MNFDLRLPIGIMFSLFGGILTIVGIASDPAAYKKSLGININLIWGLVLLLFGICMLVLALRARGRSASPSARSETSPAGSESLRK